MNGPARQTALFVKKTLRGAFLFFVLAGIFPREAWVSGALSERIVEERFLFSWEETAHRRFADPQDAEDYYRDLRRKVLAGFLAADGEFAAFTDWAEKNGVDLLPFDPIRTALPVESVEQWRSIDGAAYPINLRFKAKGADRALQRLEVTVARAPDATSMAGFIQRAGNLTIALGEGTAEAEAAFEFLPSRQKAGAYAGVWIGAAVRARPATAKRLEEIFQKRLDALFPAVAGRLPDAAAVAKHTGISNARPLAQALGQTVPAEAFNPFGPLLDNFWRARLDRGNSAVIVLFTPESARREEQPSLEFHRWLGERFDAPGELAVLREAAYFRLRHGRDGEPYRALSELKDDTSDRFAGLLVETIDGRDDSLVLEAAERLSRMASPAAEEFFLRVAREQKPPKLLPLAAVALARRPRVEIIQALTAVWNNQSLEWSHRYPARDAVRAAMEKWPDAEQKKKFLSALID